MPKLWNIAQSGLTDDLVAIASLLRIKAWPRINVHRWSPE
jgi:hypothetical protein